MSTGSSVTPYINPDDGDRASLSNVAFWPSIAAEHQRKVYNIDSPWKLQVI
jgi:hypothetical protein